MPYAASFDPIAFEIGPLVIRWYALAYLCGILIGWRYAIFAARKLCPVITKEILDDLLFWATLGIVLGGRLGYVFFYKPFYYLDHPLQALALWQGGMSFHGGFLGVMAATLYCARKHKIRFWSLMDMAALVTPIGLFLGRIANFINGELFGRVTDSAFGMIFPHGGPFLRHPSQLYEAALEGILLFLILNYFAWRRNALNKPQIMSGIFALGYGLSRFIVEFAREPDAHLGFLWAGLSMGQLLSLPLIAVGLYLINDASRKNTA